MDRWTFEGVPRKGHAEVAVRGDPTLEDPLRVRMEEDALPHAGFSSEKAVGDKRARKSKLKRRLCQWAEGEKSPRLRARGGSPAADPRRPPPLRMERETGFEPATLSLEG